MFKKLMVAVDFDKGRGEFLKCLGGLKEFGAREAVVTFCVDMPDIAGVRKSMQEILGVELEALCEIVRQTGLKARPEILVGPPLDHSCRNRGSSWLFADRCRIPHPHAAWGDAHGQRNARGNVPCEAAGACVAVT